MHGESGAFQSHEIRKAAGSKFHGRPVSDPKQTKRGEIAYSAEVERAFRLIVNVGYDIKEASNKYLAEAATAALR